MATPHKSYVVLLVGIGIPIVNLRWFHDYLRYVMAIPKSGSCVFLVNRDLWFIVELCVHIIYIKRQIEILYSWKISLEEKDGQTWRQTGCKQYQIWLGSEIHSGINKQTLPYFWADVYSLKTCNWHIIQHCRLPAATKPFKPAPGLYCWQVYAYWGIGKPSRYQVNSQLGTTTG